MALDPNIALGVRPLQIEMPNQLAQYAQISQIQNAQNQNRMANLQMQEYERARTEEEGTRNFLQGRKLFDPDTLSGLAQFGKTGLAYAKQLQEQANAQLTAKNVQSQIEERDFGTQRKKLDFAWNSVGSAPTPQDAIQKINEGVKNGVFDMKTASAELQQLQNMTPEQYQQYRVQKVMGILDAKDKLGFMLPKVARQDVGGSIVSIQDNPALPGYGLPVAGMAAIPKTATIADNLAAAKFAFEKANPTMSIQEDSSGLLAVNTRTGVATPIVYGPTGFQAAPAAAPGASMLRQPPSALPGQRTAAIPGMASVLDQTGAPATPAAMPLPSTTGERVPGQPVTAKKPLPEAYAKQAMGVANTNDALEKMLSTMKNFKSSDMLNPTKRAELGQAHATTLLFAKELFNLGVLNGGDERIVNSVINNPIDFSSTAVPIDAIRKQARDLQDVVDRTNKNLSTIYKMPVLKLERSTPSEVANDIHSQAEAILRGTPPRGNP